MFDARNGVVRGIITIKIEFFEGGGSCGEEGRGGRGATQRAGKERKARNENKRENDKAIRACEIMEGKNGY